MKYRHLFSEGSIGKVQVRNRTVMAAMVTGWANYDGTPSRVQSDLYEERARNGLGLLITGATRVDNFSGTVLPRQLSMAHDRNIAPFAALVERMHAQGTRVFCQLHHAGGQGMALMDLNAACVELAGRVWPGLYRLLLKPSVEDERVEALARRLMTRLRRPALLTPSGVPSRHYGQRARAMSRREVTRLIGKFVDAAGRVKRAGGDGVELHAAHGYLIQQFLSPHTNRRRDLYGGGLDNRLRFAEEIIEGIRREHGRDFAVIVRLTVDEYYREIGEPGRGIELEEGVEMARRLERAGADAIDVSSANYETMNWWLEPISFEPGWRKHLARAVKEAVGVPVIAANLIRSPQQAEEQLAGGIQDFVALGRPLLADPAWVSKAAEGREDQITRCISCLWCMESLERNGTRNRGFECAVNPRLGRERATAEPRCDGAGRVAAVVGAGPAGLTAARVLAERGFRTVVFERAYVTGGQLNPGGKPPHKEKMDWCREDLEGAAVRSGAEIRLGAAPCAEDLEALSPCAVIVATGGRPVVPGIPGVDRDCVCTVEQVLEGAVRPRGERVAVIGSGMTGLEAAELLAGQGNSLIVVEMLDEVAPGAFAQNRDDVLSRLKAHRPEFLTSHRLVEIGEGAVVLEHARTGRRVGREVDRVVLSVGVRSDDRLARELKGRFPRVITVGDALKPGRIHDAVRGGFDAAWGL